MAITGHRSKDGVRAVYKEISEEQEKHLSDIIQSTKKPKLDLHFDENKENVTGNTPGPSTSRLLSTSLDVQ